VFYNPAMAMDRDIGVAFVSAHFSGSSSTGWEMLAATGVRGLRLIAETGCFASYVFTEASPEAAEVVATNARPFPAARVVRGDAHHPPVGGPFDYVDLDPYGSPLPFLSTAVASTRDGGVLAVTATDMMVLAGAQSSACERRYGSRPVRGRLGPEGGLRILLATIAREARGARRSAHPLLAYVRDHHVRAYVRVGPESPDPDPVATIDPAVWEGPYLGDRGPYGPLWLGAIVDPEPAARLELPPSASEPRETAAFLARVRTEAAVAQPFYYEPNELAGRLGLPSPRSLARFAQALSEAGFDFALTHARPEGFRTSAPRAVVERVARDG
jgi:tRNA (guanine26-N2/guanine27-N2)-dimethyltransferase